MRAPGGFPIALDFAPRRSFSSDQPFGENDRRRRLKLCGACALLWVSVLVARLYYLQVAQFESWSKSASRQHSNVIQLASERGPIVDRLGKLLAVSVPSGSVYVRPKQIKDKPATAKLLAAALQLPIKTIQAKLDEDKPFVWVNRQIPRAQAKKAEALKIPGIGYLIESRRFYPNDQAAATLIGKVGTDGGGLSGLERVYNTVLAGETRKTKVVRDALGKSIQLPEADDVEFELPRGESLNLTLDVGIQSIVDDELEAGRASANAHAAYAVMINADTGEVLALSQAPLINLNSAKVPDAEMLKNLVAESVFEPGSILKPIVTAGAIDDGIVKPTDLIDCESGRFSYGKRIIKDVHPVSIVSVRDVVVRSSNIGMSKIGIRMGEDRLFKQLKNFGFGDSTNLGLPGESAGILRPVSSWAQVDVATHSFGQGIAVTPLQIVRAIGAIANGGKLPQLHVVEDNKPIEIRRIISEKTAKAMQQIMYAVVEDEHGTGTNAIIEGVRVGGKTGTAQKAMPGGRGYKPGAYVSSFVGFVDASNLGIRENLALIVSIDEPHTNSIYGGTLAAPVFKRVMQRTIQLLATRKELVTEPVSNRAGIREASYRVGV